MGVCGDGGRGGPIAQLKQTANSVFQSAGPISWLTKSLLWILTNHVPAIDKSLPAGKIGILKEIARATQELMGSFVRIVYGARRV